jgi:Methyltransferase domain
MPTSTMDEKASLPKGNVRIMHKVWREVSRPFRSQSQRLAALSSADSQPAEAAPQPARPYLTGSGADVAGFHPQQATVEAEGIPFIQRLVRESRKNSGPIVEVGTLLGITTTNIALAKAPDQKIITVDLYCWNPWGFAPEVHEAITAQMLHYLVETGHVERVSMDKNAFFASYQGAAPAMVFLDAVHDYEETKKDIQWARAAGAGIIAGHDYCDEFLGVKQAVDEFGGPRELAGTVWVL